MEGYNKPRVSDLDVCCYAYDGDIAKIKKLLQENQSLSTATDQVGLLMLSTLIHYIFSPVKTNLRSMIPNYCPSLQSGTVAFVSNRYDY